MDRQCRIVRLDHGIRNFGRGNNGESSHHSVGELFADLGDQQGTHTSTGTTTEGVSDLKALKAVTALSFTSNHIENLVDELSTLSVVTLGPVVA